MKILTIAILLFICAPYGVTVGKASEETVKTKIVEYKADGVTMRSYLAYPAEVKGQLPGILIFCECYGLNDVARRRTEELAGQGYVVLAADMYGEGKTAKDDHEAESLTGALKAGDRSAMRKRAAAALMALKQVEFVDANRVSTIGYCFGGTVVLELARDGGELRGAVERRSLRSTGRAPIMGVDAVLLP